jgi:uncharacterized protein (UPF0147 family)
MRRLVAILLLATAALASEPRTTLTLEARIARAERAWPRLTAFLEHNKVKVQAAEAHNARRSVVASRCRALSAMEAYLAQPIPPDAKTQLAQYLTVPPEDLIADITAAAAALDELTIQEEAAQVRAQTAAERAQLDEIANDPKLPEADRAQLKEELAALAKTEADLATAGEPVPASSLELARTHREKIESWLSWRWK